MCWTVGPGEKTTWKNTIIISVTSSVQETIQSNSYVVVHYMRYTVILTLCLYYYLIFPLFYIYRGHTELDIVTQTITDNNLVAYPEIADATLLAIREASMSPVGTSIVTPLISSTRALSLALSAELCGRAPNAELERSQYFPLGCGTGGAEGDRFIEVLAVSNPEGRVPGTERAEWDMDRRFEREA